jgi:tetratricopeptide (TPR) repeat protein
MSERDIQRWSREVAEDPAAPSFVRLARAYRKQGRPSAAREIVERGLAVNPEHLAAHSFLALIHVEDGDRDGARDEWETVLRLDPENFDALRGLGFLALERNALKDARRYLEGAARLRRGDPAVAEALQLAERRAAAAPASPAPTTPSPDPWTQPSPTPSPDSPPQPSPTPSPDSLPQPSRSREPGTASSPASDGSSTIRESRVDPGRIFESLGPEASFIGGLLLDEQGRPLAGSLASEKEEAGELLGALLHGVAEEAQRTTELLGIGGWDRLLIDGEGAILHASALADGAILIVAAQPGTPAGWVVRLSDRARELARRFLEVAS